MLERLGLVLYWLGCGTAVVLALLAIVLFTGNEAGKLASAVLLLAAFLVWLLGRALRFILSG